MVFFLLNGATRLSNVRYADDIMLFAKTEEELIEMVELLVEAFRLIGLELNVAKSKILTNAPIDHSYVDVTENFVEIIDAGSYHKYLGRHISGEFAFRQITEINHRIQVGWYKFGQHKHVLCNRNIGIHLRLKLFDAVVTPTILYGLVALPLSSTSLQKIEVVQRKMLRKIVGWVRLQGESWEATMHRMKDRVEDALKKHPVMLWRRRIGIHLWKYVLRIKAAPSESWIS